MSTTVFLRLLEAEDKAGALLAGVERPSAVRFSVEPAEFSSVPRSPFAYWLQPTVRHLFRTLSRFESAGRIARKGLTTSNDERYVRVYWEICAQHRGRWSTYAKGGPAIPFHYDTPSVLRWDPNVRKIPGYCGRPGRETDRVECADLMGLPGLTWPLRAAKFTPSAYPSSSVFSARGYVILADRRDLLSLLGLTASSAFDALFKVSLGRSGHPEFIVGILQGIPIPALSVHTQKALSELARGAWSRTRELDTATETSHAFRQPALLPTVATSFAGQAAARAVDVAKSKAELADIQAEINELCFGMYGLGEDDRRAIEHGFGSDTSESEVENEENGEEEANIEVLVLGTFPLTAQLASWTIGVSFGRFDLRLATGERPLPPEPDPFDPLPACSPGMLTDSSGLPLTAPPPGYPIPFPIDGILVDDPGHDRDILARIHQVFTVLFASDADDRLAEAVSILDPSAQTLRPWLRRTFFEEHIQRYSKSRRKAPIYWRLGTPSGSYSVWIYIHRFNKDTLHRVLNDHVAPKLRYESSKLATLQSEAGPSPAPSQRKALADQEALVDELHALRAELDRVAPLWDPDLDDGVVINASFLHRLFAHTRAWQKECESHWQKLQKGEYDWAHLAMRLWPERVVPKCADDRSLAIAHGLEDVLWQEGPDGKWRPLPVTDAEIAALVQERTRPAVKDALRKMGEMPEPAPARKARAVAPVGEPKAPKKPKVVKGPEAVQLGLGLPDDATPADLNAVRAALHGAEDGLAKSDLLGGCGLDESAAAAALTALVQSGEVVNIGAGRGTRYRLGGEG